MVNNYPIAWSNDLSVNVKVIDKQHQHFIEILNSLYNTVLIEGDQKVVDKMFKELKKYANYHFATEEKLFKKFAYPEAQEHIEAHQKLNQELKAFEARKKKGEDIVSDLLNFMEDWLVSHLNYMDKKYSQWFNDHGLY
jgi:methyl-accepting chemotaxis protein/hemerythrin